MFQKGGFTKKGWRKNRGGIIARSTLVEHRHIFGWGGGGGGASYGRFRESLGKFNPLIK